MDWNAGSMEQDYFISKGMESTLQGYTVAEDGSLYWSIGEQDKGAAPVDMEVDWIEGTQAWLTKCEKEDNTKTLLRVTG